MYKFQQAITYTLPTSSNGAALDLFGATCKISDCRKEGPLNATVQNPRW